MSGGPANELIAAVKAALGTEKKEPSAKAASRRLIRSFAGVADKIVATIDPSAVEPDDAARLRARIDTLVAKFARLPQDGQE